MLSGSTATLSKFVLWFLTITLPLIGQIEQNSVIEVKYEYDQLRFRQALTKANELLQQRDKMLPEELVFLHQYAALSFYNLGEQDSARVHFLSALSIRPSLTLDAGETSPKIIEFFESCKASLENGSPAAAGVTFDRYIMVEDKRLGASWRSAIVPGWGQIYKEQKTRGIILGTLFWSSMAAFVYSSSEESSAKDAYGAAIDPIDITGKYDTYNTWFKRRRNFALLTSALWAITLGDAMVTKYVPTQIQLGGRSDIELGWTIRF